MIRVFAAAALCVLMTACSSGGPHRFFVAMRATQYVQTHGGHFKDYKTYWIPSAAMAPTLPIKSMILVDLAAFRKPGSVPARGDIITFKPPIPIVSPFIKRVIALPGDRFSIEKGVVHVNGHAIHENYITEAPQYSMSVHDYRIYVGVPGDRERPLDPADGAYIPPRGNWFAPDRVPSNCYLVLGDNRNDSDDSHLWGCVRRGAILGKVVEIYK